MAEVSVNPKVLVWAREERSLSKDEAALRVGISVADLEELETGAKKPSLTLLRKIADKYDFPHATLAMPQPLPALERPRDHRTIEGHPPMLSMETMLAYEVALDAQETVAELVADDASIYRPPALATITISQNAAELGIAQRRSMGISLDEQLRWRDPDEAYRKLREAVENLGIFVFQKEMPLEDCRGFSVYAPKNIPIIVVNKNETTGQAKAFTLLHELGHVLLRDSGLCDENRTTLVERFCNQFAANFLMPPTLIERAVAPLRVQGRIVDRAMVKDVARKLRVSQQSMALRLEELGYAPAGFYDQFMRDLREGDPPPRDGDDAPRFATHERRKISEFGKHYAALAIDALQRNLLTRPDAVAMLGTTGKVFTKVRAELNR